MRPNIESVIKEIKRIQLCSTHSNTSPTISPRDLKVDQFVSTTTNATTGQKYREHSAENSLGEGSNSSVHVSSSTSSNMNANSSSTTRAEENESPVRLPKQQLQPPVGHSNLSDNGQSSTSLPRTTWCDSELTVLERKNSQKRRSVSITMPSGIRLSSSRKKSLSLTLSSQEKLAHSPSQSPSQLTISGSGNVLTSDSSDLDASYDSGDDLKTGATLFSISEVFTDNPLVDSEFYFPSHDTGSDESDPNFSEDDPHFDLVS